MPEFLMPARCFFLAVIGFAWSAISLAAPVTEAQRDKNDVLRELILHASPDLIAAERRTCVMGQQPAAIDKERARVPGAGAFPDATEYCVTVATRMGMDAHLLQPYQELQANMTGTSAGYEAIPAAIAGAIMQSHANVISLSNGKQAVITSAMALDSGFTTAYQQRPALPAAIPDMATLKPIAERCLALKEPDLGLCYSAGFIYGVRAAHGLVVTASR